MTTTTTTLVNTDQYEAADFINARVHQGYQVKVNGREVASIFGDSPAFAFMNGTVGVHVKGRTSGKFGAVYVKSGESCTVEVIVPQR